MPPRRRHHKAEKLSIEAQRQIDEGLANGQTYRAIAAMVFDRTGEKIAPSSVGRYDASKARPHRNAQQQAMLVADRLVDNLSNLNDADLARALKLRTAEILVPSLEAIASEKPGQLAAFFSDLDANRIEDAKVAVKNREIDVRLGVLELAKRIAEGKLEEARKRAADALKPVEGRARSREDLEQAIRDLYGITTASSTPPANTPTTQGAAGGSGSAGGATVGGVA